jgi:hypothetical protein
LSVLKVITRREGGGRLWKSRSDLHQTDVLSGKGPSKRHEIYDLTESNLSAVRIDDFIYRFTDQPNGWFGATVKVDWPILTDLRLDPLERTNFYNGKDQGFGDVRRLVGH